MHESKCTDERRCNISHLPTTSPTSCHIAADELAFYWIGLAFVICQGLSLLFHSPFFLSLSLSLSLFLSLSLSVRISWELIKNLSRISASKLQTNGVNIISKWQVWRAWKEVVKSGKSAPVGCLYELGFHL